RVRSSGEFHARAADIAVRQSHSGLRRTDRRGIDDRTAYPIGADEQAIAKPEPRERIMNIPVFPETKVALKGKKGLIVGIANDQSSAWGCAKAFCALGAELAVTYLNDRAKKHVEPLAQVLEAPIFMPLDVNAEGQMEQVFERIAKEWGRL